MYAGLNDRVGDVAPSDENVPSVRTGDEFQFSLRPGAGTQWLSKNLAAGRQYVGMGSDCPRYLQSCLLKLLPQA